MGPKSMLRLKLKLHARRRAVGAYALLTLTTAGAGLLLTAPGSEALPGHPTRRFGTQSAARKHAGFHRGVASWYYDNGSNACGFHAGLGVANRTLPCGTHVIFLHGSHRAKAVVDDRGPYVAGRGWDLNERLAHKLHVSGVATVWAKWN